MSTTIRISLALLALSCGGIPAAAGGLGIGIFGDSGCETTCIHISQAGQFQFYVRADLAGVEMNGASFRIEGLPAGLFLSLDYSLPCADCPCGIAGCSNPFTTPGIDMFWPFCQTETCVQLFRAFGFATVVPPQDTVLRVVGRTPPLDPMFDCPMITLCDAPVFTRMCVEGGVATINPSGVCPVAIEAASWSQIKSLYD